MARVGEFDRGVDEGAAAEVAPPEPPVQNVVHGEQTASGILGAGLDLVAEPGEEPLVERVQARRHQLILGPEVLVDRDLGDRRLGRHLIHADRPYALPVEEPGGGVENPGVGCGLRLPVLVGASLHGDLRGR
jgi:hypothetical protein